jgi:hypothetical protein
MLFSYRASMPRLGGHEELDSRDVAAVVRREEHHGLGNLLGSTESPELTGSASVSMH